MVMCIPIDKAAPKGRLILPQVMAIRDVLDNDGIAVMAKEGGFDVQRFVELEDYTREAGQILAQRDVNTEVDDEDDEFPFGTHCEQCIEALLTPKECADKWMKKQRWAELSRHSGRSARRRTLRC